MMDHLRPSTAMLSAVAAWTLGLALLALAGLAGGYRLHPDDSAMAPPLPVLSLPAAKVAPQASGQALAAAERPLFSSDRRPAAVTVSDDAPATELKLTLTGVISTPQAGIATFADETAGKTIRARVGQAMETHPGWRLVSVEPRKAVLEGPEGQKTLELRAFDGSGGQAPTPVSAPIAPAAAQAAPGTPGAAAPANAAQDVTPADQQAEAIRRRIEARRAEMRDVARRHSSVRPTK